MSMEIGLLADQNIWWKGREKMDNDYDIARWMSKKHRWEPRILGEIGMEPYSLHIVLGPRQVGKTTAVKLLIRRLVAEKDPRSVFYFNCEELADYKELSAALETYLEFREKSGIGGSFIFLDEITSPKEWYRSIKSLIDSGKFRNDVVVLTGSSSINLRGQAELFPGRRGKGRDFVLLPLSFREFIRVFRPDIHGKIEPANDMSAKEIARKSAQAAVFTKELNALLEQYFARGGFPLSLDAEERTEAGRAYLSWIKTEVLKAGRSDAIAREIIKVLLEKMQTPVSWEDISKDIEIKSPKTVAAYVQLLRSIFSIILLYHIDLSSKSIKFGKNKKVYPIDPVLLDVFEDWCMFRLKNKESILAESLAAMHLTRYSAQKRGSTLLDEGVFYWMGDTEIDIILNDGGAHRGFEVKWTDKFDVKPQPHLKDFMVISKSRFSDNPAAVPLSIFLSLLDV